MHALPNSQDETQDDALHAANLVMDGEAAHREMRRGQLYGAAVVPSPQAITVATVRSKATVIMGEVGSLSVEIMFDSGSAVSLTWIRWNLCST